MTNTTTKLDKCGLHIAIECTPADSVGPDCWWNTTWYATITSFDKAFNFVAETLDELLQAIVDKIEEEQL